MEICIIKDNTEDIRPNRSKKYSKGHRIIVTQELGKAWIKSGGAKEYKKAITVKKPIKSVDDAVHFNQGN